MFIPTCVFGRRILEKHKVNFSRLFQVKPLTLIVVNDTTQALKKKIRFLEKLMSNSKTLIASQYLKTFLMRLIVMLVNVIFKILCDNLSH